MTHDHLNNHFNDVVNVLLINPNDKTYLLTQNCK